MSTIAIVPPGSSAAPLVDGPPPGRRRLSTRFLAWALPVVLIGDLTEVAVKVSSAPPA